MEIVFILLIFLVPGLCVKMFEEYTRKREHPSREKATVYESLFSACLISVGASATSIAIINTVLHFCGKSIIKNMNVLTEKLNSFGFVLMYVLITGIICCLGYLIYKKLAGRFFEYKDKKLCESLGVKYIDRDMRTVWEDVFLNKDKNKENQIVAIYKDGNFITSGILEGRNIGSGNRREFRIIRSNEIGKVMKADEERAQNKKWLKYVDEEYFDMDTGILIKFYDSKYTIEHWKDFN